MYLQTLNRRDFLSSSALASATMILVASGLLAACSKPAERAEGTDGEVTGDILPRFARLLYPHVAVEDTVYEAVSAEVAAGSDLAASLNDARTALNGFQEGAWLSSPPEAQIAALAENENALWFATLQAPIRTHLYNHPAIWDAIGYEGPSAHLGGYINRGFDDIDWLPEVD